MPLMIDTNETLDDGRVLAFYMPNLSMAALHAMSRWARVCLGTSPRLGRWLMTLTNAEIQRRAENDPPVEAILPRLDVEAFESYALIQAMDECVSMGIAVARMDAPLGKLCVLMYATLSAEAQQRARRGEP